MMIVGKPGVIERDGEQIVVDGNGDELVCRNDSGKQSEGHRIYHRIDVETYAEGNVQPECGHKTHNTDRSWILRRRKTIDSNWRGCWYRECYGDYDQTEQTEEHGDSLAAKLRNMSVEEFDATAKQVGGDD